MSAHSPDLMCLRAELAQRQKRGAHLLTEELRLLPGGEMAAPVDFVVVDQVVVGALDPVTRRLEDLAGEDRVGHREPDVRWWVLQRRFRTAAGLPVDPRGRGAGARQPVERDVVEDMVP